MSSVHALAGSLAGVFATSITYPLIAISTRAQVEKRASGFSESTLQAARRIIAQEGALALFDGLSTNLVGIAVTNGIFYMTFEEARTLILRFKHAGKSSKALTTLESIIASSLAGCITSIMTNGIWVVSTSMTVPASQTDAREEGELETRHDPNTGKKTVVKKLGFLQTVEKIYNQGGVLAFFRGLGPALILVINPVIAYTAFEQIKNVLLARRKAGKQAVLTSLENFILGAFTKLLATGSTYPYLTVKSRMQAGGAAGYTSAANALRRIIDEEGLRVLYRGIAPKLAQSMLTAAILFASKEQFYLLAQSALHSARRARPVKV